MPSADTDDDMPKLGKGPRVRPVPAVSRAVAILRLLGRSPNAMGVKAIAQSLGMVTHGRYLSRLRPLFGAFATVMDAVKQSGITNVSIVTQPLEQNGGKR